MNNYYNSAPSTITGPTGGTSILDLKKNQVLHNPIQSPGISTQPYYHPEYRHQPNHEIRLGPPEPHDSEDTQSHYSRNTPNIQNIVADINDAIRHDKKNKTKHKKKKFKNDDSKSDDSHSDENNKNEVSIKSTIASFLKEPILLWVLFIILSIAPVKDMIGKYISVINPDENGVVGMAGVASYGLILVVLFTIIRYFI
jgi:hypothetical protein